MGYLVELDEDFWDDDFCDESSLVERAGSLVDFFDFLCLGAVVEVVEVVRAVAVCFVAADAAASARSAAPTIPSPADSTVITV